MKKVVWLRKKCIVKFLLSLLLAPFLAGAQPAHQIADLTTYNSPPSTTIAPIQRDSAAEDSSSKFPASLPDLRNQVNLYLHLDKNVYQPQETIWLTGYILNRSEQLMRNQNTLYLVLIDPVDKSIITKERFLIESGLSRGFLKLPDTLAAGSYWLLAYTNALLETGLQPVFRRLISVRTPEPSDFRIDSTTLLQSDEDSLRIKYKISTSYGGLASGGVFNYTLFDSTKAIGSGTKLIDAFGEVLITVGTKQDAGKYRELSATITRNDLSKKFIFPVYTGAVSLPSDKTHQEKMDSNVTVNIIRDSAEHHQRSKVTLKIQIRDRSGNPMAGIFSVSVATSRKAKTEGAVLAPVPADLKKLSGKISDYGYVLRFDEKPGKPVNLALMGDHFTAFQTDSSGKFSLPYSALVAQPGASNVVSVTDKSPEQYKLMLYSRADTFDRQLAAIHYPLGALGDALAPEPEEYKNAASMGILKTAVVKARVQKEANMLGGEYNSTHCDDDYVCTHNHGGGFELPHYHLNCPFMDRMGPSETTKPKEGALYMYTPKAASHGKYTAAAIVTYHCAVPKMPPFMKPLDPILRSKPFPLPNADGDNLGSGIESTIFWCHAVTTDQKGELTISFYTNDLTGDFTCTLQGLSAAGFLNGHTDFSVVH